MPSSNDRIHIPRMVEISEGVVELRDDRKKKQWTEVILPFELAVYPVTQELYASLKHTVENAASSSEGRIPMVNVSWFDAIRFCNAMSQQAGLSESYCIHEDGQTVRWKREANGYRLPTEAEWQYACKAGTAGYRYGELDDIGWYAQNSNGKPQPVGQKEPNAWGLYDMLGNVWEWCWDLYDEEVYGSYRIFRGGSWAEEARGCGATCRRRSHPTFGIEDLGFRLARSK